VLVPAEIPLNVYPPWTVSVGASELFSSDVDVRVAVITPLALVVTSSEVSEVVSVEVSPVVGAPVTVSVPLSVGTCEVKLPLSLLIDVSISPSEWLAVAVAVAIPSETLLVVSDWSPYWSTAVVSRVGASHPVSVGYESVSASSSWWLWVSKPESVSVALLIRLLIDAPLSSVMLLKLSSP
jgi:hypothetical protein